MQTPWQILELDPCAASEKDIKIAYARLVKQHRPDTDPEGFRRVREAYEIGLEVIRGVAAEPTPPPAIAEEPSPIEAPIEAPAEPVFPALVEAEQLVAKAEASKDFHAMTKAIGSLFFTCRLIDPGTAGIRLWQQSLHRVTSGRSELVAAGVTTSQLIAEMEAGSSLIAHACMSQWEAVHDVSAMIQLADSMLTEPQRLNAPEAAIVALRLALETGFASPALSMRLVNFAFPHLDRETREQLLPRVEQQSQLGATFAGFREDQLSFWHQRFRRSNANWNWSDPASDAAIEYLASSRDRQWPGYAAIKSIAPVSWFDRLDAALDRKRPAPLVREISEAACPLSTSSRSSGRIWFNLIWAIPLLVFLAARSFLPADIKHKPSTSSASPGWAVIPEKDAASTALPTAQRFDFEAGRATCKSRADELLKKAGVAPWNQLLCTMEKNSPVPEANLKLGIESPAINALRMEIQKLLNGISLAETDPTIEHSLLEFLIMNPETSEILKQEALFRQVTTLPPSIFIPIWQKAIQGSADHVRLIGRTAQWFITNHGNDLSLTASERQDLEILTRGPQPKAP
ncbi:MAG: J domain-containing protein [Verrucomicrobiaceae bacterium]|nr:J domain-containing protein [Verrucomicrobiaceae bacterium]